METLNQIDTELLIWINNGLNSLWMDRIMLIISGKLTWIPLYALLLFLLYRHDSKKFWINVITVVCCIALADQLASSVLKPMVERMRPCWDPAVGPHLRMIKDVCGSMYGFVSSHASTTFALCFFFMQKKIISDKRVVAALFVWAFIVALSRVYLGVHYPGDILCGALVGIFSTLLIVFLQQGIEKRIKADSVSN